VDGDPLLLFGLQRFTPFLANAVVPPAAAAVFRGPPFGFDQVFAFHPVQHGVKHALGPFDLAAGQFPHVLNEFIAIALTFKEDGCAAGQARGTFRGRFNS